MGPTDLDDVGELLRPPVERVTQVFCAQGNAGTGIDGVNVPIDVMDFDYLLRFAKKENIEIGAVVRDLLREAPAPTPVYGAG